MSTFKIALTAPSSIFDEQELSDAIKNTQDHGYEIINSISNRNTKPSFLNGSSDDRLLDLIAAERHGAHAIWSIRGGCGAISLWRDYQKEFYEHKEAPLIGFSDITLLHFARFLRAGRIGIHGPVFLNLAHHGEHLEFVKKLISSQYHDLCYPAIRSVNNFPKQQISGELIVMNLSIMQALIGCFDHSFMHKKILAIEEVNEPHYKIYRTLNHLKNADILSGLKALVIGHLGKDRKDIINETIAPLASSLGLPLFDWPIFGHEHLNWPLLFGAAVDINRVDNDLFTLSYSK